MTAEANAHVRFRRAIERRALWMAEDAARELPNLPLEGELAAAYAWERAARRVVALEQTDVAHDRRELTRLCPVRPGFPHLPSLP